MQGRAIKEMEIMAAGSPESTRMVVGKRARSPMPRQAFAVGPTRLLSAKTSHGYWTPGYFRRSDIRIEGPLPRHLPEVASRIPRQGSKGNGDSGRLVPRTGAGEQALQNDTPLNTESFARKGRSCSPSCSRTLPCACACARVRWIQAVAGMGEAWASVT